jgi:hypothetical protein
MTDTPDSDADAYFTALCNERGGPRALSTIQLALARKVASALAGDGDARDIAGLLALLPPVKAPRESESSVVASVGPPPGFDLGKLSEHHLDVLKALILLGTDRALPEHGFSDRTLTALSLARLLDNELGLVCPVNASADMAPVPVDEDALRDIRTAVHQLCYPISLRRLVPGGGGVEVVSDAGKMRALVDRNAFLEDTVRSLNEVIRGRFTPKVLRDLLARLEAPIHNSSPVEATLNMIGDSMPYTNFSNHPDLGKP